MWLSVTHGGAITPLQKRHKAQEAERAARVPSKKEMVLGVEREPDPKLCPLLTLLSLDAGLSNTSCVTHINITVTS